MSNIDNANRVLSRRILLLWGGTIILFFVSLPDIWIVDAIAEKIAAYFPVVKGQLEKGTRISSVAGRFFCLGVLTVPVATLFLLWGQDILGRARVGASRSGGRWKYLFTVFVIGIPFCVSMLALIYFAPIEVPQNPHLMGQVVAHSMTNTYLGLLVFGSIGIVGTTLLFFFLLSFVALPILFVFRKKGD
ncbi:MAG: hypothetical protein ACREBU_08975 [Nitrososphaera sp.]